MAVGGEEVNAGLRPRCPGKLDVGYLALALSELVDVGFGDLKAISQATAKLAYFPHS